MKAQRRQVLGGTIVLGLLVCAGLLAVLGAAERLSTVQAQAPTLQLLSTQPEDGGYLFTVRISGVLPHARYAITSVHHTDIDYPQRTITVTTDGDGVASARIWSRCTYQGAPLGYVFAQLTEGSTVLATSAQLTCAHAVSNTVAGFGSHRTADPPNDDWIYCPTPSGTDQVHIWLQDAEGRDALSGTVRIRSTKTGCEIEDALVHEGGGRWGYTHTWSTDGPVPADDYRVQLTLDDGSGVPHGLDAYLKRTGRAMYVWGETVGGENPAIWALLTDGDHNGDGVGDRVAWLDWQAAPYGGHDPCVHTSYLSVYPYLSFTGTEVTDTFHAFLTTVHATSTVRVEALAGTHEWVMSEQGLAEGKAMCDAILAFNCAGTTPAERFDGIHYDVEHDDWHADERWRRYLELIAYCQGEVDRYNQAHEPIVFGVDIPPRFTTGPEASGEIESNWDVMQTVDAVTLMAYRDFAETRHDGSRDDGITYWAAPFIADGNALGVPVVIAVELTPSRWNHVTFDEECPSHMESELRAVSRHFATDWAYKGIAIHDYDAWTHKEPCARHCYLPLVLRQTGQ